MSGLPGWLIRKIGIFRYAPKTLACCSSGAKKSWGITNLDKTRADPFGIRPLQIYQSQVIDLTLCVRFD